MQELKKIYGVVPEKNALQREVQKDGWNQFTFVYSAGSVSEQLRKCKVGKKTEK